MNLKKSLFVALLILFIQSTNAQHNYDSYNRLGLMAGVSIYDLNTSDLNTSSGTGFMMGFSARGSFYNQFDLIYGIKFLSNKIKIQGHLATNTLDVQNIDYTIQTVQVNFLGSYNIVRHHLSIEAGPMLNINGKMKVDSERLEDYILDGHTTLKAKEIQDISKVNFHVVTGLTAGLENFRLIAQYQFGITNTLNKLNDKNLEKNNFDGKSSTVLLAVVVYF